MTRISRFSLILFAGVAVISAQQQPTGWRRASDPPPAVQDQQAQPQNPVYSQDQDPTQPVDRTDAYGQPQASPDPVPQQQPPSMPQNQPNDRPPVARMSPPRYGLPPQVTIKPGTFVQVRTSQYLSSDHNQEGDTFSGTLQQPIVVDGIVVAQRGQTVLGRVTEAKKAGRASGVSHLSLQLTGLTLADGTQANIQSQMITRNGQTSVGNDVAAVGATTAMGAAIGAAADWGRGAAIGAGAGAAAGLIGVLLTRGRPTEVYPETLLTYRIDTPVVVDTTRAPQAFRYVDPNEYDRPAPTMVRRQGPPPCAGYGCTAPPPYGGPYYGGPYYGYFGFGYGYPGWYGPYGGWGGGVVVLGRGGYGYHRYH